MSHAHRDDPHKTRDDDADDYSFDEDSVAAQFVVSEVNTPSRTLKLRAKRDPWSITDKSDAEEQSGLARILELRGMQPRQIRIRRTSLQAGGIKPGMRVVELGCGTGIVTRELARMVGQSGYVAGLDHSGYLLQWAKGIDGEPGDGRVEYMLGKAEKTQYETNTFDATLAVTLLAHVDIPDISTREMVRITRPGGRVILFDQDYGTFTLHHSREELTQRIIRAGTEHSVTDPRIGRKLPGLLVDNGIESVKCWAFVYVERDAHSYLMNIAKRMADIALDTEVIAPEEKESWIEELLHRGVNGTFFASLNYYLAFGDRPG